MNGNENNGKAMSFKQRNYIRNLLTYKVITQNYSGYAGYVLKLLQSGSEMTMKQASCIIDTLKGMIELEEAADKGSNDNAGTESEEIAEEKIE